MNIHHRNEGLLLVLPTRASIPDSQMRKWAQRSPATCPPSHSWLRARQLPKPVALVHSLHFISFINMRLVVAGEGGQLECSQLIQAAQGPGTQRGGCWGQTSSLPSCGLKMPSAWQTASHPKCHQHASGATARGNSWIKVGGPSLPGQEPPRPLHDITHHHHH